jgi:hypothetical protein
MPKPPGALVKKWRDLAEEGYLYAEISRMYPSYGSNVWLRGSNSPHAELTEAQARKVLDDWDEKADRWKTAGAEWARKLGVSPSTIYMLRRGETWAHLEHKNQGRKPKKRKRRSR